jgi:hypothetical protein
VDPVVLKKRWRLRKQAEPHGDRADVAKITAFAFLFYKKIQWKVDSRTGERHDYQLGVVNKVSTKQ